jgi:hypothetical protein
VKAVSIKELATESALLCSRLSPVVDFKAARCALKAVNLLLRSTDALSLLSLIACPVGKKQ